jgi:ATP-dependent RNA helicase DDX51/DBP6
MQKPASISSRVAHAGGIVELFPVQTAAWALTSGGASAAHDLCIAAPTGSGKTLAYALPIVQGLTG